MRKIGLLEQTKDALRAVPGLVTSIFILSIVVMNLLANKSVFNVPWLAATSGVFVSWVSFLCMDSVCKRFGYVAATLLNTVAMVVSLATAILIMIIMKVPGVWAASFSSTDPEVSNAINTSLDVTFSSAWYIIVGSSLAMFLGGVVNTIMNHIVGVKLDNQGTYKEFAIRSVVSTALGQFTDNFVFGLFVSHFFFGWTMTQVIMCSFFMMILELVFEVVFTPVGYHVSKMWKKEKVGEEYIKKYDVQE